MSGLEISGPRSQWVTLVTYLHIPIWYELTMFPQPNYYHFLNGTHKCYKCSRLKILKENQWNLSGRLAQDRNCLVSLLDTSPVFGLEKVYLTWHLTEHRSSCPHFFLI
jgi:hypothetical protein